jgi:hypothetical protein
VLLSNDFFDTGLTAMPYAQVLRISNPTAACDIFIDDTFEEITSDNPYIELDEEFWCRITFGNHASFDYEFLYQAPGLLDSGPDLIASTKATVLVSLTDDEEADADGVPDDVEGVLLVTDGNSDGIFDVNQSHVATLPAQDGCNVVGCYVTLEAGPGTTLHDVQAIFVPSSSNPPEDAQFPAGFFKFTVVGVEREGLATVTIYLHGPVALDSYYKFGKEPNDNPATPDIHESSDDHWYEFLYDGVTGAKFFDSNDIEVAPHTHALVSRIVLHFKDGSRGDSLASPSLIEDPGGPASILQVPQVESVVINDGAAQRSMVNSLTVTFDGLVTVEPGAFEVYQQGVAAPVPVQVALSESLGRTVARLTFQGPGIIGGSLADGQYRLVVRGDKIRDAGGRLLDGDGDSVAGGNYVDEFFRLFGDIDGDGDVDTVDAAAFKPSYRKRIGNAGYLWYFDHDASGRIGAEDFALLLLGYRQSNPQ